MSLSHNQNKYSLNYPLKEENRLINQDPLIKHGETIHYLCVNSSDRNVVSYPKVNSYRINFEDRYKSVSSIEIISGSLANQNSVQSFPYIIVKTGDYDHLNFSNSGINRGFALLYLKPTSGAHVQPELGCLQRNVRIFNTPIASLNSIDIQLLKPDGSLFDFGEPNGDITTTYQNSFVFKIVCEK